jgi:hypothetical protein
MTSDLDLEIDYIQPRSNNGFVGLWIALKNPDRTNTKNNTVRAYALKSKLESKLAQADESKEITDLGKRVLECYTSMLADYEKSKPYEKDFVDLFLDRIVKGVCDDCGETKPCAKHYRPQDISWYANSHKFIEQRLTQFRNLEQELAQLRPIVETITKRKSEIITLLEQKQRTYDTMFDALEAKGREDPNTNHYYKSEYNALNKILEDEKELKNELRIIDSILAISEDKK